MAKKKKEEGGASSEWMATYADMVTLLMTFFIVLLSMSNTDEQKFNAFLESFKNIPDAYVEELLGDTEEHDKTPNTSDTPNAIDDLFEQIKEYVAESSMADEISMMSVNGVIYIRFNSSIFFLGDQYTLRSESIPVLSFVGSALKSYEEEMRMVNVLGFTAQVQNGTYWMLAGQRASAVALHLNFESDIDYNKITTLGYGSRYPVAPNDTEINKAKNRRVELIIVGNDSSDDFSVETFLEEYHSQLGSSSQSGSFGDEVQLPSLDVEANETPKKPTVEVEEDLGNNGLAGSLADATQAQTSQGPGEVGPVPQ